MTQIDSTERRRGPDPVWALVPVKRLDDAKRRLASHLRPVERQRLCRAMLEDVLATLSKCERIDGVTVVSDDDEVAALARRYACEHLPERELGVRGLNGVVSAAVSRLAERGVVSVMVVHGDLPMLTPGDVASLLDSHAALQEPSVTIATDRHRSGSNCVLASPAATFEFCFGCRVARHVAGCGYARRPGGPAARNRTAARQPYRQLSALLRMVAAG
jgi:2-phospho-L-lactate guanylyltransferase